MKKVVKYCFIALVGLGMASCGSSEPKTEQTESHEGHDHSNEEGVTGSLKVNNAQSSLNWEGGILSVGDKFVKSHNGTIVIKDGSIQFENGNIVGGKMVIDMTTITPLDDNFQPEEGKTKEKLVGHLSSDDFFNVAEYPEASYKFQGVVDGVATGEMSLKGKTNKQEARDIMVSTIEGKTTVSGRMTVDRQIYGATFSLGAQDMFLSDNINITFTIVVE